MYFWAMTSRMIAGIEASMAVAIMCEDVARTVHIARQIGQPLPIAQSDVDSLFDRYQRIYGQP